MQTLKSQHKVLALILAVMLAIGMMPITAYAAPISHENIELEITGNTVTATLSGLSLPDTFDINQAETSDYELEWNWGVYFSDGNWIYCLRTAHGKYPQDSPSTVSFDTMDDYIYANRNGYGGPVADENGDVVQASMSHTSSSITWSATFPNGEGFYGLSFDMEDVIYIGLVKSIGVRDFTYASYKLEGSNWTYLGSDNRYGIPLNPYVFGDSTATPGTTTPTNPSRPSGNNNNRGSGSDRGNSSSSVSTGPVNVTSAAATTAVNSALAAAKASGANSATANIKNPGDISLSTLKAMANQAGTTPLKLQADSMSADGRNVDVRITLDPKLATSALNLSASTTNAAAKTAETIFEKCFSNNVSVVSLGQKGSFGQPVEIAAKIDPTLDTANLVFYSYNSATNRYTRIANPAYWVDRNGYVHFTTRLGGNIIISDGALTKQ